MEIQTTEYAAQKEKYFDEAFKKKIIYKACLWLSLITITSIALVFFFIHTSDMIKAISGIQPKYILICLLMVFADLMLGSWRNHIFIRHLQPGLSHWISFKANLANMFMGAVTPFHSGAGAGQLYVYHRHGVKIQDGLIVSLINTGATLLFMPVAGIFAIFMISNHPEGSLIPTLLKYSFSVFLIFLTVFILTFRKPLWTAGLIQNIAASFGRTWPSKRVQAENWGLRSYNNIIKYQQICSKLLKENPLLFPLSLVITTLLYLNKCLIQYMILLSLGIHTDILQVISLQILIQFMIYFAPGPGGSGFAEAGIAVLFAKIVPTSVLPVFTLLQRSFLLFIPALTGAYVIISLLKKHTLDE